MKLNLGMLRVASMWARSQMANLAGKTFDGNRDLYKYLGYKRVLTYQDYYDRYKRNGIARRVVNTPATATWRNFPIIQDKGLEEETPFLIELNKLTSKLKFFHYAERADKLAGIGRYSVMLVGVRDGRTDLSQPIGKVSGSQDVLYLSVFSEGNAEINTLDVNPTSERFGLPETYRVKFSKENISLPNTSLNSVPVVVHHTRVIHISDGLLEDDVFGDPRLECVWNYLDDLEKISGGTAEAFWRVVDRGMAFIIDKEAELGEDEAEELEDEIDAYVNRMKRFMRLKGMDVKTLGSETPDPRGAFSTVAALIAGTVGIPNRVLFGSERGELASSQDEKNFNARIKERQQSYAGPMIVIPFINKLISIGALPAPINGEYELIWPDLSTLSQQEEADIAARNAQAIRNFGLAIKEFPELISPAEVRTRYLKLPAGVQK